MDNPPIEGNKSTIINGGTTYTVFEIELVDSSVQSKKKRTGVIDLSNQVESRLI